MPQFRKKPVVVEAEQFWPDKTPLPFNDRGPYVAIEDGKFYVITAHAQKAYLAPGDWVILEAVGPSVPSFAAYPCKPDIFEATYEAVANPDDPQPWPCPPLTDDKINQIFEPAK